MLLILRVCACDGVSSKAPTCLRCIYHHRNLEFLKFNVSLRSKEKVSVRSDHIDYRWLWFISNQKPWIGLKASVSYQSYAPINVKPGRQGMWWGFDCLCRPWSGAFDWSCFPRIEDIWIFPRPTCGYLTAASDERDCDQTYVSRFHASRMHITVWKDLEIMEANENKRKVTGFYFFVFKLCLL